MNARALKYLSHILLYSCSAISFTHTGFYTWLPVLYAFAIVPLAELFVAPSATNMEDAEEDLARKNPFYDGFLYIIVPLQAAALFLFLNTIQTPGLAGWETAGRIISMGLLCGTFGINVGHELGHRSKQYEQAMAKFLLSTSLYIHFFIEHNKGHHRHVATPQDPSSARYNEPVYLFYFRTIIFSYISAWQIANEETRRRGKPVLSFYNRMLTTQALQLLLPAAILLIFGPWVLAAFIAAAFFGILLLETVNYIEHYGLQRKQTAQGNYERALPIHSWNSNHVIGRVMLFELSRHSDHHYLASRKYQVLRHHDDAPQLPTGYPGSMILSLVPPLWFAIMNPKIKALENEYNLTQKAVIYPILAEPK